MTDRNPTQVDVMVIGGGSAALCAAMTVRENGASVVYLSTIWIRTAISRQDKTLADFRIL